MLKNEFFDNFASSIKISYTRYSKYITCFGKRHPINFGRVDELVGMIGLAKTDPKWLEMAMEGYVLVG